MDLNEMFERLFSNDWDMAMVAMTVICAVITLGGVGARDWRAVRVFLTMALVFAGVWGWLQPAGDLRMAGKVVALAAGACLVLLWIHGVRYDHVSRRRKDGRTVRE